jgi:hypothetical protein
LSECHRYFVNYWVETPLGKIGVLCVIHRLR